MNLPKSRRCKAEGCYVRFKPLSPAHVACGLECVEALRLTLREKQRAKAEQAKRKEQRTRVRENKAAKEQAKTKSVLTKEAQKEFNTVRRLECLKAGMGCISCGRSQEEVQANDGWKPGGLWDCGHFQGVGAHPSLRFEPNNAWLQCKVCNGGSGKYAKKAKTVMQAYRINLVELIGLEAVEALEVDRPAPHWTHEQLREIRDGNRARANQLKKEMA